MEFILERTCIEYFTIEAETYEEAQNKTDTAEDPYNIKILHEELKYPQ